MKKLWLNFAIFFMAVSFASAQEVESYTFTKLSQEPINVTNTPTPVGAKEVGDTTFTLYTNSTTDMKVYFVHGDQYDNIFNPNPTGIYLNGQHFEFFCSQELSFRQHVNMFLDVKEFTYLGKSYLVTINFWENCMGENCRYRCYNVFEITDPNKIVQHSFNSIFEGVESFGEFNNDGVIDYVRAAPKPPKGVEEDQGKQYYLVTAFSFVGSKTKKLANKEKSSYYLYAKGDEEVKEFKVLEADWFYSVKDTSGNSAKHKPYFQPYISFDPFHTYLFDPEGFRIEKNRWSVRVKVLNDVEGAKDMAASLQEQDLQDVFILTDQYSNKISFQILVGNYQSKDKALQIKDKLAKYGIDSELFDLKVGYK